MNKTSAAFGKRKAGSAATAELPVPSIGLAGRLVQSRAAQQKFVSEINAKFAPFAEVAAHPILPESLWEGPLGQLLSFGFDYTPTQPWNTLLLPVSLDAGRALRLPYPPPALPQGLETASSLHIAKLGERLLALPPADDTEARLAFLAARKTARDGLFAWTHAAALLALGHEVYYRHLELFGELLRWDHATTVLRRA